MQFIAVDPVPESAESMTTYNYAGNNPVVYNDPLGNFMIPHVGLNDQFTNPHIPKMGYDGVLYYDGESLDEEFFDMRPGGGGGGGGSGFSSWSDFNSTVVTLQCSVFGGTATSPTNITFFNSDKSAIDAGVAYVAQFNPSLSYASIQANAYDNYNANSGSGGNKLYVTEKLDPAYIANRSQGGQNGFQWNEKDTNHMSMTDVNGNQANGSLMGVTVNGNKKDKEEENPLFEMLTHATAFTESLGYVAKHTGWIVTGEKIFGKISNTVGITEIGVNLYKGVSDIHDGNYAKGGWNILKATGSAAFMYFGGAEERVVVKGLGVIWSLGTDVAEQLVK